MPRKWYADKILFLTNIQQTRIGMKFLKGLVLLAVQMITSTTLKTKNWIKDKYKNLIKQHTDQITSKQAEGLIKFTTDPNGNIAASQEEQAAQAQLNTEAEPK